MADNKTCSNTPGSALNGPSRDTPANYPTINVRRITPAIGVEVTGVDMTKPVSCEQVHDLEKALANHNVLFFRDQPRLTPHQQVAFARNFGDLHFHPAAPTLQGHPEVFVIHTHEQSQINNGGFWHSDVSCDDEPPLGTILQLHQTPSTGGDTLFANMYAAFEELSEPIKHFLRGLTATHESEHVYRGRYADRGVNDDGKIYPSAEHPVVRTHPVSGREALYVNRAFTTRICHLQKTESDAILAYLFSHMEKPQFQVRFQWQENAIAFWDNRCTLHFALWDYWPAERKGHRVTIKGERPFHRAT